MSTYVPAPDRYDRMQYRRCGRSGLLLPAISLGLWQNFGGDRPLEDSRAILRRAFDLGVTHIDLANNYGPPYGSAEENFGTLGPTELGQGTDVVLDQEVKSLAESRQCCVEQLARQRGCSSRQDQDDRVEVAPLGLVHSDRVGEPE